MTGKQIRTLESLRRVRDHFAAHPPRPAPEAFAPLLAALGEIVAAVEREAGEQSLFQHRRLAATARLRRVRRELRVRHIRPITRMAQALGALLGGLDGLDEVLRMPPRRFHDEALAARAEALASAVEPHAALFVAHGLSRRFLERLRRAAAALRAGVDARAAEQASGVGATASLRALLSRGRRIVRVLDAMLAPRIEGDAPAQAVWRLARRVVRGPSGSREAVAAAGTEPHGGTPGSRRPQIPQMNADGARCHPAGSAAGATAGTSSPSVVGSQASTTGEEIPALAAAPRRAG